MEVFKVLILSVVIAVVCMLVKHYKPEYSLICELCGIIIIGFYVYSAISGVIDSLGTLTDGSGMDASFFKILIKALAVSVVTDIASAICKDSGNSALAGGVELFGKTVILVMAVPMLLKLTEIATGFIK